MKAVIQWYTPNMRRQFRLLGIASIVGIIVSILSYAFELDLLLLLFALIGLASVCAISYGSLHIIANGPDLDESDGVMEVRYRRYKEDGMLYIEMDNAILDPDSRSKNDRDDSDNKG